MITPAGFCPRCGTQRRSPVDRFCRECGADVRLASHDARTRFCPTCGTERPLGAAECAECSYAFGPEQSEAEREVDDPSSLELSYYQTNLWLVTLLCLVTAGLYLPVWMALTWSELKRVYRDVNMYPVWHGLSVLVPIYGWLRFYQHCVAIDNAVQHRGGGPMVRPRWATAAVVIGAVAGLASAWTIGGWFVLLWLVSSGMFAGALAHTQTALNYYRRSLSNEETPVTVRGWEWGLLFFGSIFILMALFAAFGDTPK